MVHLYLARHGETEENAARILQGHLPGTLTAQGRAQAEALRDKLRAAGVHFDVLLASDLRRAHDTARIVNEAFGLPLIACTVLRERDWGCLSGRRIPDISFRQLPADVETVAQMHTRALGLLRHIKNHYDGRCVLAVGHGLFNRCIQAVLLGKEIRDIPRMDNAEVRLLELDALPESVSPGTDGGDKVSAN